MQLLMELPHVEGKISTIHMPADSAWKSGGKRWVHFPPFSPIKCQDVTAKTNVVQRHSPQGFANEAHWLLEFWVLLG
jgi:hypothetical protein